MRFTAEQYVDDVLRGRIVAGRWVRLACERHRRDMERGQERGLWFDERAAQFAITFFHLLPLWEGEKAGQPMALEPCQQFWVASLFGWKRADGTRRFRVGYLEVGRKNGKTPWAAGVGLLLAFFDGEPGAQVYSAATKRDQAMICHHHATQMVKRSPSLSREVVPYRNNLHSLATASKFEPLSSDYNKLDGLNSHGVLADELHAWPSGELWGVLETSQSSRRQPLMLAITTAGVDLQSICWVQREYLMKVLLGQIDDDSFWGVIYTLDTKRDWPDLQTIEEHKGNPVGVAEDDWQDEQVWVKANPMLGVSKKWEAMRQAAKRAANQPSKLNMFLRWDLNIWTQASERWISPLHWAKCGGPLPDLAGRRCYAGLDLSATQDITALVLVFPPLALEDVARWWVVAHFWCPEEAIGERSKRDRVPYEVWRRQGHLVATPGNIVDYAFPLAQLEECRALYDLRELAYDRWGSQKVVADLQEIGFAVDQKQAELMNMPLLVQFGQGYASMSGPMKETEKLIAQGALGHGDNPVLAWMADNVVKTTDPAGNIKPDKGKSREKIDGIVALIMGMARAIVHGPEKGSVYEERGLRTL